MKIILSTNRTLRRLPSSVRVLPHVLTGFRCQSPTGVDIELSNRCNLNCRMCWFNGESGIGDIYRGQELTTQEVFNVVDELAKHRPKFYVGGSEPFIREDFLTILQHIKSHELGVSFTTNGTLLDLTKIMTIVAIGVDEVSFSIDGPEASHDEIRGRGVFRKAASAIKELAKYKKAERKEKPIININITVSSSTTGRIEETISSLAKATNDGADFYRLHHLWYITPSEFTEHQRIIKQALNCSAPGASSHIIPVSQVVAATAVATEISSLRTRPKIKMFPTLDYSEMLKYYSEDSKSRRRCIAPFFGALIKPNGDVKFCPDEWIDDYILGNIRHESFDSIWNNDKARKFRAKLWHKKSYPGCKRCSWMFSF